MFIPFGLIGMLSFQPINRLWARIGLVLLLGFILAFVLQGMQIYLPTRSPALSDVLWNIAGIALGIAIGLFVEKSGWSVQRSVSTYLSLPSCILFVWFVAELLPLVPSLDLQEIKNSFKPLLLDPGFSIVDAFSQAAGVLLAGRLLAAIVGESASIRVLPALIGLLLIGKVVVVTQVLDLSTCVGVTIGYVCWWVIHAWREPRRSQAIFFALFFAYTLSALMPLAIRTGPAEFNWIPFADSLQGSMLTNVQAVGNRLAVYGGLLWLWQAVGGRLVPGSIALALWVLILETVQSLMQGRTATISEPLWVLIVAIVMTQISRFVPSLAERDTSARRKESPVTASALPDAGPTSTPRVIHLTGPILRVVGTCAILAALIAVVLRVPGVPYNVRELFLGDGNYVYLLIFSAALLWIGAGGYWVGWRLAISRYPYLLLPALVVIASILSLLLLSISVTQESIADIAGSNNVYWFVTNKGIWGAQASMMFTTLDMPGLVAFFERPIRYTALYGPLVIFPGVMFSVAKHPLGDQRIVQKMIGLLVSALLCLWLCKAIAFDWASTDNLNELIARDGHYGWGGGGYLYLLLALACMNAVVLSRIQPKLRHIILVTVFTAVAVSIGWVLLNLGLEQRIEKYGQVFSGVQFLLGPDRSRLLSGDVLFLRWAVIYVGGVMIIATGYWLAHPFLERWEAKNNRPKRVDTNHPQQQTVNSHNHNSIHRKSI